MGGGQDARCTWGPTEKLLGRLQAQAQRALDVAEHRTARVVALRFKPKAASYEVVPKELRYQRHAAKKRLPGA